MAAALDSIEVNAKAFLLQILGKTIIFLIVTLIAFWIIDLALGQFKPNQLLDFLQAILLVLVIGMAVLFSQEAAFLASRKFILVPFIEMLSSNARGEKIVSSNYLYKPFSFLSESIPIPSFRVYGTRIELLAYFEKFHESIVNGFFEIFSFQASFGVEHKRFSYIFCQKNLEGKISRKIGRGYNDLPALDHSGFYEIALESQLASTVFSAFSKDKTAGEKFTDLILEKILEIEKKNPHFLNTISISGGIATIEADIAELSKEKIEALIELSKFVSEKLENPAENDENRQNAVESIETSPNQNENPNA